MTEKVTDDKIDYAAVFNSPEGERVLRDLAVYCGLLEPSSIHDAERTHETALYNGRRDVLMRILTKLNRTPLGVIDKEIGTVYGWK